MTEPAKDMHPTGVGSTEPEKRRDDRNLAGSAVGKADDAQRHPGQIDESPAPDPEEGDPIAEDDPEAD